MTPTRHCVAPMRGLLACTLAIASLAVRAGERHPVTWYPGTSLGGRTAQSLGGWAALPKQPWHVDGESIRFTVKNGHGDKAAVGDCKDLFKADAAGMTSTARRWPRACLACRAVALALALFQEAR